MSPEQGWCSFRLGESYLAVAVDRVQEVLRNAAVTRVPPAPPAMAGLLNLRGRIVPVVSLRAFFGLTPAAPDAPSVHVIVRDDDDVVSLEADAISDVRRAPESAIATVSEALGDQHADVLQGVLRCDETLVLLLDLDAVLDLAFEPVTTPAIPGSPLGPRGTEGRSS